MHWGFEGWIKVKSFKARQVHSDPNKKVFPFPSSLSLLRQTSLHYGNPVWKGAALYEYIYIYIF